MEMHEVIAYIRGTFEGVETTEADGDTYFIAGDLPADQRMPFATLITSDAHDTASDLDRPGVFRLNIGVTRETYTQRFGPPPPGPITIEPVGTGFDYRALDVLMPHPIYASLAWLSILNPSETTFEEIQALLAEAHAIAHARHERHSTGS
jgi:hypothetical protein